MRQGDEYDSMLDDGEHLYPWCSVDNALDARIIELSDIKYGLRVSRHFGGFPKAVEAIRAAWATTGT